MSHNNDTYMQEQMLLQLHEQYAVNNNAKLSSAVTLIVGLLAVIGAYGYVFLHVDDNLGCLCSAHEYTLDDMILTAMAAIIVLAIMKHICMYQGFAQRRDQFIIYAIRFNYGLKIKEKYKNRIFPDNYHPFNKEGVEIYQGLFGEFIKISSVIQLVVFLSAFILFCLSDMCKFVENSCLIIVLFSVFVICYRFSKYQQNKNTTKYEKLCKSYKSVIDDENQNNDNLKKGYCDVKILKAIIKCIY